MLKWISGLLLLSAVLSSAFVFPGVASNDCEVAMDIELEDKIDGINFTAPERKITSERLSPLVEAKAGWISIIPYAYCRESDPKVKFNSSFQWWGERTEGVIQQINFAREHKLKIMLKPHIWVIGQGWLGEFDLQTEEAWREWEQSYRAYVMTYAQIADSLDVELLCVGTEAKVIVRKRPDFWFKLIKEVREVYSGKLTYAANWDNYQQIPFWEELDYIGIDAYFPLSEENTPSVADLQEKWKPHASTIKSFSQTTGKPVLFTEFGYMSADQSAWRAWELESSLNSRAVNLTAQRNAYEAIFSTFWVEPWFAGGFLWKWFYHTDAGGLENKDYTPQGKPALKVIQYYYF